MEERRRAMLAVDSFYVDAFAGLWLLLLCHLTWFSPCGSEFPYRAVWEAQRNGNTKRQVKHFDCGTLWNDFTLLKLFIDQEFFRSPFFSEHGVQSENSGRHQYKQNFFL